ncbi:MAG: co-chaperone GroES [Acidimicrobiales bacterium]
MTTTNDLVEPDDATASDSSSGTVASAASDGASNPTASNATVVDDTRAGAARLPIKMLNDRILVKLEGADGERRSSGGILIPATAQVGKRLTWAVVMATGPSVRSMQLDDRVLFNPEDRYEVEVGGRDYIILRERDVHAVAAERLDDSHTGLYL